MTRRLPAEWEPQSLVQFTFPHPQSDWAEDWPAACKCFVEVVEATLQFQPVLLVAYSKKELQSLFPKSYLFPLHIVELPSNDSWARDHGPVTILENEAPVLLDFGFNGWGLKFPADLDNLITKKIHQSGFLAETPLQVPGLILEGGSIESDGAGTLLTTTQCLLSPNRNPHLDARQIEEELQKHLGAKRIIWLRHGHLMGDDTDAHIDTLARFCNESTIAYVNCEDDTDEHYVELQAMKSELQSLRTISGEPYQLIPLPLPDPIYANDGHRLPATYANFLLLNAAVLVPTYGQQKDEQALSILQEVFPDRKVLGIDCRALIRQHGSLHCVSMQYPVQVKINPHE